MKLDGHFDRQVVAGSMSSPTTASEHLSSKGWDFADRQLWRELGGRNGHSRDRRAPWRWLSVR